MEKLPAKSKERYMKTYETFMQWNDGNRAKSFSESVFLAYFTEISKVKKPSSLWATYSMLRCTMQLKHNVNITKYDHLNSLLKRLSAGYKSKKSKIFTADNVMKFLSEAPDDQFLATKVILILGIKGACRTIELTNMTTKNIENHDNMILVKLYDNKTQTDRLFVIRDELLDVVRKYEALRPENPKTDRFFLNYKNGKCSRQPIGKNTIASTPKLIAQFLDLPEAELYTGHCFRRSSGTLLADSGANLTMLKRHGGWRSDKVVESYIDDLIENESDISSKIDQNIKLISSDIQVFKDGKTSDQCSTPQRTRQVQEQVKRPAPPASQHRFVLEVEVHTQVALAPLLPRQTVAILADTDPKILGKHKSPDDDTETISKPNQTNSSHVSGREVAVHTQEARVPLLHEEVLIKTENDPTCDIKCEEATDDYILGEPNSEVQHEDYMCCECNTNITGFRYVCVQCAEYDLCGACEAGGAHCSHYVLRVPGLRPHWEVRLVLEAVRQQLDAAVGPPPPPSLLESQVVPYDVDIKEEPKPDPLEDCIMHIDIEPSSPPPLTPAPSNHTKKDVRRPRISGKRAATRNRSEQIAITSSTTAVAVLGGSCVQVKEDVEGRVSIPGNRKSTRKRPAETSEDLSDTLQSAICKLEPNLSEPGGPNEDNCSGATFVTCGGLGEGTT